MDFKTKYGWQELYATALLETDWLKIEEKIQVADPAQTRADIEAMKEKAEEFKQTGAKIYHEVGSSGSGETPSPVLRAAPKD